MILLFIYQLKVEVYVVVIIFGIAIILAAFYYSRALIRLLQKMKKPADSKSALIIKINILVFTTTASWALYAIALIVEHYLNSQQFGPYYAVLFFVFVLELLQSYVLYFSIAQLDKPIDDKKEKQRSFTKDSVRATESVHRPSSRYFERNNDEITEITTTTTTTAENNKPNTEQNIAKSDKTNETSVTDKKEQKPLKFNIPGENNETKITVPTEDKTTITVLTEDKTTITVPTEDKTTITVSTEDKTAITVSTEDKTTTSTTSTTENKDISAEQNIQISNEINKTNEISITVEDNNINTPEQNNPKLNELIETNKTTELQI